MNFASPNWLWLLLLLLPLTGLLIWNWRVKQRLLTRFVSSRLIGALTTGVSKERQRIRLALFVVAVAALLFALARPRLGFSLEEARQRGLDIVVAVDTSKSMLADDVQPNRLQRAKLAALDLMRLAESDRLGLVAFAGSAFLQCPLSLDEEAFRQSVEFLDVSVIPQGGTALGEAIEAARAAFKDGSDNHKILVLFTDGEENEDQEATLATARQAAKVGLRIFTVGVGTPAGEVLSTTDPYGNRVFIKDAQGNVVKSRLNEPLLQQLARETDGFYLPLTGARTMDVLYERGLAPLPKSEFSTRTIRQHHERFQWFLGAAIVLLLIEMLFPERAPNGRRRKPGAAAAAIVALTAMLSTSDALGSANNALKDYEHGQFARARNEFERLARKSPDDARLRFNAGAAAFRDQDYENAVKHFSAMLSSPDVKLLQQGLYNLGNTYFRLGEKEKQPQKILEQWQQATNQYSLALKVDDKDTDAKYNLELVTKKIEELKKQQQQQKQQQQNQDDKKQDEKQDSENKDKQDKNKQEQQKKDEEKKSEQQDQKQDQQQQKDKQDQQKEQEKKDQQTQPQPDQEQKKQDEQQSSSQDQRGKEPDKSAQAANYGRVMPMTQQQAQQLLDAQKSEERAMIFQPQTLRTNRPPRDRVFKDW